MIREQLGPGGGKRATKHAVTIWFQSQSGEGKKEGEEAIVVYEKQFQ